MILQILDKIYKNDSALIKYKAYYLLIIQLILFLFCFILLSFSIIYRDFSDYMGYLLGTLFTPVFIFLILKKFYKITIHISSIFFAIIVTIGLSSGHFLEYEIIFFTLLIIYVLFFSSKKAAFLITAYCIVLFSILYLLKRETHNFSSTFYITTLSSMIILYILSLVHFKIIEEHIRTITRQNESLEQKVIERTDELKKSKEYSETLFNNSPIAIYSTDKDGQIINFNKQAETITGYSQKEMIGLKFNFCTNDCQKKAKRGSECSIKSKDNKEKIIDRYSTVLRDDQGHLSGNIESFLDITNWRELEEFKEDIEKVIRHDLKTPLNSIIGFPKIMLTDDSLSDEYKEYLTIILHAGQNMLNLINASLNMYKLEEGTYKFNFNSTNVISILAQIHNILRKNISKKECSLELLYNNKPYEKDFKIEVNTEKSLLNMILINLIKNALEASPSGEKITVNMMNEESLTISIHNKGSIPEQIRSRFFEKNITHGKKGGNGLGTYSAKLMANAINAELYFTTGEKEGTSLFLKL